jgi:hypothetical protein
MGAVVAVLVFLVVMACWGVLLYANWHTASRRRFPRKPDDDMGTEREE